MIVIQCAVAVIWAVVFLSFTISAGVGGAIQAAGLSKTEEVPFFLVFLLAGVLAALTGTPLFLWIF